MARSPRWASPRSRIALLFLLCWISLLQVIAAGDSDPGPAELPQNSPVARVIRLLKSLQIKVTEHGKNEDRLFEKFLCSCKATRTELQHSLEEARTKKPQLQSSLQESQAAATQLESGVQEHKQNLEAAKTTMAEQKSLRADKKAQVDKESAEMTANVQSLREALAALRQAAQSLDGSALLQSSAAAPLQAFAQSINPERLRPQDREALNSLLQQLDESGDGEEGEAALSPGGHEVIGVLQQMLDDMVADLDSLHKEFEQADAEAEALIQAKSREAETLRTTMEDKLTRLGGAKVKLAQLKSDITAIDGTLKEDATLLDATTKECQRRVDNHNKMHTELLEELSAIQKAIEVLANERAAQTFMKSAATSSPVSFVQVAASSASGSQEGDPAQEAALEMQRVSNGRPGKGKFSALARRAARASKHKSPKGVGKIIKLVDSMLTLLVSEQEDDDLKEQMCKAELDRENKHKKIVEEALQGRMLEIQTAQADHATVEADIAAIRKGIENLDKSVAQATEQRKQEHDNFVQELVQINAGIALIRKAKLHLTRYYDKVALLQEEQQKKALAQTKEESGDSDDLGYSADNGDSSSSGGGAAAANGADGGRTAKRFVEDIKQLMGAIEEDLNREAQQARTEDEDAQRQYQELTKLSEEKRTQDAKSITYKAGVMAELAETIRSISKKAKALRGDAEQTAKVIADLHDQCDWLLKNYEERKRARTAEHDALERSKAILHGAGYQLAQVKKHQGQ